MAIKKNGTVRTISRWNRDGLPLPWRVESTGEFRHHAQSNSATGRNTTWVLESRASKKATRDALYAATERFRIRWSSISKKSRAEIRKKNMASMFFSSEIQAT